MSDCRTYSVTETATILGHSRSQLDRWIVANRTEDGQRSHLLVGGVEVPVLRIGGRWRIVAAPLDALLRVEVAS